MDSNVLSKAIGEIAKNVPGPEDGDYTGADGLLYCGKCRTPKQCWVNMFGKERKMPVMCACRSAELDAEKARQKEYEANLKRRQLRRACFPSVEYEGHTFAADDRHDVKVSDAMRRYADQWQDMREKNIGLLLHGSVGTGKSFYASCIANSLIDKGVPVLMTNFVRIINTIQGMYGGKQEYIDSVVSYPLLILDDLGAERQSDYMLEQVYNIIDARYQTGKPLIITTNVPFEEIKEPQDIKYKRIYSRVLEMCYPVRVDGSDRRRDAVKSAYLERKRLLGL